MIPTHLPFHPVTSLMIIHTIILSLLPNIIDNNLPQTSLRLCSILPHFNRPPPSSLLNHTFPININKIIVILKPTCFWRNDHPNTPQWFILPILTRIQRQPLCYIKVSKSGNRSIQKQILAKNCRFENIECYCDARRGWTCFFRDRRSISSYCR